MHSLLEVKALEHFQLWLRYDDGTQGAVDVSSYASQPVFACWHNPGGFEAAHKGEGGSVEWSESADLCADALYLKLTGRRPEDIFPALKKVTVHA
ncbi:MAG: DUF2442 domain-containing protein [Verrucomicrobiota bacterium]|nr:DUF2442 domain-containing protein [Verrucomicrobiota bacterium]